jgi:predicted oxidoreductase
MTWWSSGSSGRTRGVLIGWTNPVVAVECRRWHLRTDRLDLLLLNRPDPLAGPEEMARASDELQASGEVRHFGLCKHAGSRLDFPQSCAVIETA